MIIFVGCSQYTYKPSLKYNPKANLMANAELILTQQQLEEDIKYISYALRTSFSYNFF